MRIEIFIETVGQTRGRFRGGLGGGGGRRLPQGFDPLPTQRVPPLILF